MKSIVFVFLGLLSLILGLLGIILPILPTTPFLLLTAFLFAKGSKRFEMWFKHTRLYQNRLKSFIETKSMKKKEKWILLISVDIILVISMVMINQLIVTIILVIIDVIKYLYFIKFVTTIPEIEQHQVIHLQQKNTLN